MDLHLKDRTALVTGASVGIGAGTAKCLAEEGCKVVITARRGDQMEQVADEIAAVGHTRPVVIVQDIMKDDAAANLKKGVDDALGHLDILVNNAGAALPAPVGTDEQIWIDSMNLNWWAVQRVSDQFIPGMVERKWGRIINVTGTMEPISINAATCAKAAVQAWSKGLSCEHSKDGVTSNCIIPAASTQSRPIATIRATSRRRLQPPTFRLAYSVIRKTSEISWPSSLHPKHSRSAAPSSMSMVG